MIGLSLAAATHAHGDTGRLAGSVQMTAYLDFVEFVPDEPVCALVCFENVSDETVEMSGPGPANVGYLDGEYVKLLDANGQEVKPTRALWGNIHFAAAYGDAPFSLEPGEMFCDLALDPDWFGHTAHYAPGHYGSQVRFYYYEEHPADGNVTREWKETHYKWLESNPVWFDRVEQLGKAKRPRLSVKSVEVAEARPLRFDRVLYADSRGLSPVGIKVDIEGDKVVASRGEREGTLTLGKWNPEREKQRPALARGGAIYLPLRQVATALGLRVNWDPATQTVDVRS